MIDITRENLNIIQTFQGPYLDQEVYVEWKRQGNINNPLRVATVIITSKCQRTAAGELCNILASANAMQDRQTHTNALNGIVHKGRTTSRTETHRHYLTGKITCQLIRQ